MKVLEFRSEALSDSGMIEKALGTIERELAKSPVAAVVSALEGARAELAAMGELARCRDERYQERLAALRDRHLRTAAELGLGPNGLEGLFSELETIARGVFLLGELSDRSRERILDSGSVLAAAIVAGCAARRGFDAALVDAGSLVPGASRPLAAAARSEEVAEAIRRSRRTALSVVGGRLAPGGEAPAGGEAADYAASDYAAAVWAVALKAEELQIWGDSDGVMSADPSKVRKAIPVERLSYEEVMELSHFGASFIHPPSLRPALAEGIPIRILNARNPSFPGTTIGRGSAGSNPIKGISSIDEVALINVQGCGMVGVAGIAGRVFDALAGAGVNVMLITQASSEHSICAAVRSQDAEAAGSCLRSSLRRELETGMIDEIRVEASLAIVAIVGENMRHTSGISGKLFATLGRSGINVVAIAQGSSELNISIVIRSRDEAKALNAVHDAFFLSGAATVNVFAVGVGVVGSALLGQIARQRAYCLSELGLDLRVVGLANSRRMIFDEEGIDLGSDWKRELAGGSGRCAAMSPAAFLARIKELNLPNGVFVDCTASLEIARLYPALLGESVSIVAANKLANVQGYEFYASLRAASRKHNCRFLYETNVGAGLPVIGTLDDLVNAGEKVIGIEAVLSGTMSFVFNEFMKGGSLGEIVREARRLGYSEPDPRIDLGGTDIARKILILAREAGFRLELSEVAVERILPDECFESGSVEDFLAELDRREGFFAALREEAVRKGEVLRYIAVLEEGRAGVHLASVGREHPAYSLNGSENLISFRTANYRDHPLVIKGPGAGAEVTAGGVLADILRLARE